VVTFSRSNPATDVGGIEAATAHKHWGCRGSLVIDARRKPHHAPLLVEDPQVTARVDGLFAKAARSRALSKRNGEVGLTPPRRCECRTGLEGAGTGVALRCHSGLR